MALSDSTLLVLTPVGPATGFVLSPWSARGLTQTIEPIAAQGALGQTLRRSINGALVDMTSPIFRKLKSTVTCSEHEMPALDDAWLGQVVTVKCVAELAYLTGGTPARTVVSGSSRTDASTGLTYYRPQLTMMVTAIRSSFAEWDALWSWQLDLEEL
jgi:hypothetical protein